MIKCEVCGKQVPPRNKRFCSQICSSKKPNRYWAGKTFSDSMRLKLSESHIGKNRGHDHPNWKGERAGYVSKHAWMRRTFGTPRLCEHCNTTEDRRYEWANISGEYKRDRADWLRLCKPCHAIYDDIGNRSWQKRRLNVTSS